MRRGLQVGQWTRSEGGHQESGMYVVLRRVLSDELGEGTVQGAVVDTCRALPLRRWHALVDLSWGLRTSDCPAGS